MDTGITLLLCVYIMDIYCGGGGVSCIYKIYSTLWGWHKLYKYTLASLSLSFWKLVSYPTYSKLSIQQEFEKIKG